MSVLPLPQGWSVATIMDAASVSGGATPSKVDASYWAGGTIPWVSPKDMKRFVLAGSEDAVTAKALDRLTLVPADSILVVVRSGILSRTLPVAINVVPVTINQDMRAFVPSRAVVPRYLAWQLIANERDILDRCAKDGTTVASIEGPALASYPFAVAPFAEQTRIVDKLEKLLSDLDAGVAELKAAQRKLAQYRQSLLKAAVEGRLTEAWRAQHGEPEESGAQLLARILRERRARWAAKQLAKFESQDKAPPKGWQSKYPEPVALDTGSLAELPHGWVWTNLDMLIEEGPQNGLYLPAEQYGRGCPILRIDDFQNGWARPREDLNLVDADRRTLETYALSAGDLVVNRVNSMTHLGKTLVVDADLAGAIFESNMMRFRLNASVDAQYVGAYLGSELGRMQLVRDAKWAVNQASINQQDVKRTPVPLAPVDEQGAVVEVVSSALMGSADQGSAIGLTLRQSAAQRKNILQAAFSGQLVPQDPNDEPTSLLLARIRAERAARSGSGAARGRRSKGFG